MEYSLQRPRRANSTAINYIVPVEDENEFETRSYSETRGNSSEDAIMIDDDDDDDDEDVAISRFTRKVRNQIVTSYDDDEDEDAPISNFSRLKPSNEAEGNTIDYDDEILTRRVRKPIATSDNEDEDVSISHSTRSEFSNEPEDNSIYSDDEILTRRVRKQTAISDYAVTNVVDQADEDGFVTDSEDDQDEKDPKLAGLDGMDIEHGVGIKKNSRLDRVNKKLIGWGRDQKDWTQITELEKWLRAKEKVLPKPKVDYLDDLLARVEKGEPLESLEKDFPPSSITKWYWGTRDQLRRFKGTQVVLLMGFCPQYCEGLDERPEDIEPEDSGCLTKLIISWIAREVNGQLLCFDFRPDCRKNKKLTNEATGYSCCAVVARLKRETTQLIYLAHILVRLAQVQYNIDIVGTITFSNVTNEFIDIVNCRHMKFRQHISHIWANNYLGVELAKYLSDWKGQKNWYAMYESFAKWLLRGPDSTSGRVRIKLPLSSYWERESYTFRELVDSFTTYRKNYGKDRSEFQRKKKKARAAIDPAYAKRLKDAKRSYGQTEQRLVKAQNDATPGLAEKRRKHKSELQRARRKSTPGYAKAYNDKRAARMKVDPIYKEKMKAMFAKIGKKCKDKVRAKVKAAKL